MLEDKEENKRTIGKSFDSDMEYYPTRSNRSALHLFSCGGSGGSGDGALGIALSIKFRIGSWRYATWIAK